MESLLNFGEMVLLVYPEGGVGREDVVRGKIPIPKSKRLTRIILYLITIVETADALNVWHIFLHPMQCYNGGDPDRRFVQAIPSAFLEDAADLFIWI